MQSNIKTIHQDELAQEHIFITIRVNFIKAKCQNLISQKLAFKPEVGFSNFAINEQALAFCMPTHHAACLYSHSSCCKIGIYTA